jgi:hypothetical protein
MSDRVAGQVRLIEELCALLKECSDELAQSLEHEFRDSLHYPSQKRRFDRDMDPVNRARELLRLVGKP